jgi:hypothetical protein
VLRIYLESGKSWTFACAVDWPGWCRRGKGEEGAIDTLLDYRQRYAAAVGKRVSVGEVEVVGRIPSDMHADFGAPGVTGPWDDEPLDRRELKRQADILQAIWSTFDDVVAGAPATLRKGPRGGGRDRDAIVDHVREAERSYGRKLGPRVPPRTPWPEQRRAYVEALLEGTDAEPQWPVRYWLRRTAWHVLDHAWEIEDKS